MVRFIGRKLFRWRATNRNAAGIAFIGGTYAVLWPSVTYLTYDHRERVQVARVQAPADVPLPVGDLWHMLALCPIVRS